MTDADIKTLVNLYKKALYEMYLVKIIYDASEELEFSEQYSERDKIIYRSWKAVNEGEDIERAFDAKYYFKEGIEHILKTFKFSEKEIDNIYREIRSCAGEMMENYVNKVQTKILTKMDFDEFLNTNKEDLTLFEGLNECGQVNNIVLE
jgi:hypothetical protein